MVVAADHQPKTATAIPFEDFSTIYPKKTEMKRARRIWGGLSEAKRRAAVRGAQAVAAAVGAGEVEVQFVPGGAVFLCGERWTEWESGTPPHLKPAKRRTSTASERALGWLEGEPPLKITEEASCGS